MAMPFPSSGFFCFKRNSKRLKQSPSFFSAMVVFNCKCGPDGDAFLYETTTDTSNDDLIAALVSLHNERVQARLVVDAVRGLCAAGPMVEPEAAEAKQQQQQKQEQSVQRCGNAPDPDHAEALEGAAAELGRYVDKSQAQKRVVVSEDGIAELVGKVREVIQSAYPDGLPEWDVLSKFSSAVEVDEKEGEEKTEGKPTGICKLQELLPADAIAGLSLLDSKTTSLWVAGKEFERGKLISDRLGSNEKTRVVAKLSREGNGPPPREPIVRDDERNAMLEHYHKRNEELKRLADNEDDEYMNSAWADPRNMARELQGLGSVRAPGLHRFG